MKRAYRTVNRAFFLSLCVVSAAVSAVGAPPMEKMVLIEANIWEINENSGLDYGVVWDLIDLDPEVNDILESSIFLPGIKSSGATGAFITAQTNIFRDRGNVDDILVAQMNTTIQTALREGSVHLRANPKLLVKNGSEGKIHSGEKVPFTELRTPKGVPELYTTFKDTGVTLTVTPTINPAYPDFVRLHVVPEVADITSFVKQDTKDGEFRLPVFSTRRVSSDVIVRTGGTIILSGLIAEQKKNLEREVPLVSKIPVLGWLFRSRNKSRTKSDILVEITATIVAPGESRLLPNGLIYEGEIFQADSDVAGQIKAVEQGAAPEKSDAGFNPDEWFESTTQPSTAPAVEEKQPAVQQ